MNNHHLPFDGRATGFNRQNAYSLACLSSLVYEEDIELLFKQLSICGFSNPKYIEKGNTEVLVLDDNDCIIIVFRGTESIDDIKDDMSIAQVPLFLPAYKTLEGHYSRVHNGFNKCLREVWNDLLNKVDHFHKPGKKIWITGHSLGGALAILTTVMFGFYSKYDIASCYTYGAPRVGDRIFRQYVGEDSGSKIFRLVNNNDIVSKLPPVFMGYVHVGKLKYINRYGKLCGISSGFQMLVDGILGRFRLLALGDGVEDHFINSYIKCLKNII